MDDEPLGELISFYSRVGRIAIRIDREELKAVRVDENVVVPMKVGDRLTLRSWLNLTLAPFGLTYVAEKEGLRVVRHSTENVRLSRPSPWQIEENASSPRLSRRR